MAESLSQSDIDALLAIAAEHPAGDQASHPATPAPAGPVVPASAPATPQPAAPTRHRSIRRMDFARPSKFNKDQLRTLQMLHEAFCRRASTLLSGSVRSLVEVSVTGTEQLPYSEYVQALPVPTFTTVLELAPLGTNAMASMDLPLMLAMIDRMLGGPGTSDGRLRELTEIESGLALNLMERMFDELGEAWRDLVPLEFRVRGVEMNAQFAQIVPASEPSVLISMEVSIGTASGSFQMCLPYRSIEAVVGNLAAHRYFAGSDDEPDHRAALLSSLQRVSMPVRAEIGSTRVPMEAVLGMSPGDVIPLGRRVEDGVRLVVGNTRAYSALPGRDGSHVAVRVVDRIDRRADGGLTP